MSAVFISHSSADALVAAEIAELLRQRGHRSIFLDFDPALGFPAGRSWEKELYAQLRACRVVIVLCSAASMASDWCFAEITHARALGKHVIPVKIAPCVMRPLLMDVQIVDLTVDRENDLGQLWRGLEDAGLDPAGTFERDPERPPYPGLLAFEEQDAAVLFGRDAEIRAGLDVLRRQHRFDGARFVVFLGASGSGKSSLVRAGLVPRLRRDGAHWQVLGVMRPSDAWPSMLAALFTDAFARCGSAVDRTSLLADFEDADRRVAALLARCRELRVAARALTASVVLVLDQLEEAFDVRHQADVAALWSMVGAALAAPRSPLLVAATLRSDFFGVFQTHASVMALAYEQVPVDAIPVSRFPELIEGPAQLAGLELAVGLTGALVQDTAAADALPLLAFALRELWERRSRQRIDLATYRNELGGLAGSVARAAEAVLQVHRPSSAELAALLGPAGRLARRRPGVPAVA
ncbi:MAG TPA: toll/interleukin-1 receptor domain-containing protein [Kofleriaceae bacterium]